MDPYDYEQASLDDRRRLDPLEDLPQDEHDEDCKAFQEPLGKEGGEDDEDYLSVDSSLLEEDIYMIDETELRLPEPTFEPYHPRQHGVEEKYGTYRLTVCQIERLFIQLSKESAILLEEEQLVKVSALEEAFDFHRRTEDFEAAAHQLDLLMELVQDLTHLERWIERVLDGDFTWVTWEKYFLREHHPCDSIIAAETHTRVSTGSTLSQLLTDEGYQALERITRFATSKAQLGEGKLSLLFKYGQGLAESDYEALDIGITEWMTGVRPELLAEDIRQGKQGPLLPDGRFYSRDQQTGADSTL